MGTFLGELGRRAVVKGLAGIAVTLAATEAFHRMRQNSFTPQNPFALQTQATPIHRLPEPSAARVVAPQANPPETAEQQAERMTMLSRSLFEHLGIGESNDLKRDSNGLTFDERMTQRETRVYPKMLASRQVLRTDRPLRTFDFPATDAQELPAFAINENAEFPVDAEVRVFHASETMDFFAARWHPVEKRWVFTHVHTQ